MEHVKRPDSTQARTTILETEETNNMLKVIGWKSGTAINQHEPTVASQQRKNSEAGRKERWGARMATSPVRQ
jgi:hypothetical protein